MPFAALLAPIIADVVGLALGAEAAAAIAAPIVAGVSAADVIGGTLAGAAGGALLGGVEGGGQGALRGAAGGALTGGALSFAPAAGAALGGVVGAAPGSFAAGALDVAAGTAIGAGAGALGSEVTGGKPLTGAETGGAAGLVSGLSTAMGPSAAAAPAAAPAGVGAATSPATVSIPSSGGTGGGDTASAMGDLFSPNVQGGSIVTGPASQVSASPLGTTTGTISGSAGGGGVGTISGGGGGGTSTISPTPDLSIGMTPAQQSATLGALTDPSQIADVQGPSIGDKLLGGIEDYITNPKNLIQLGIGGAGLLMSGMKSNQEQADLNQLEAAGTGATSMARALDAPLFSGVLPPGAQDALNLSRTNQIAQVRSTFANLGMAGSTSEADAINAVNQNVAGQQFNIEDELFGQASPYASLASTDYQKVLQGQRLQDEDFSNALSRFVAALTGGTSGTKTVA